MQLIGQAHVLHRLASTLLLAVAGVAGQMIQLGLHFTLGLGQQSLWVARQLAHRQQVGLHKFDKGGQRGGEWLADIVRKSLQALLQSLGSMLRLLQAHGVAAQPVGLGIALQGLGLADNVEVGVHQRVRDLQRLLGPPEAGGQGDADGGQQTGVEQGQGFQAHERALGRSRRLR